MFVWHISEWEGSRLFGEAPADVLETLTSTNATSNFHKFCVLPQVTAMLLTLTLNGVGSITKFFFYHPDDLGKQ